MGLSWQGSEYSLVLLPPGIAVTNPPALPVEAITEANYNSLLNSDYDIQLFDGYGTGYPYKFFRINNPGLGQWTYAILEDTAPDTTEPLRVYMANESDLILEFRSDKERYTLLNDQNGNPIPITINMQAKLYQGGETSGLSDHTKTVGEPVDDAAVSIQITSPDGQIVAGRLEPIGNGLYTISLETTLIGNYDINVIASDDVPDGNSNNSQYFITTKHSFYVSPFEEPTEFTGKLYIQYALDELNEIMNEYCVSKQNCSLDSKTKKNISAAISLIQSALGYFENDGNHLKTRKGLNFYGNITTAVNDIYAYISNVDFGDNIDLAIFYLKEGSYKLAVIARDEAKTAIENGNCQVSNCDELLKNANSELGKAIDDSKQDNYVYVFNHLTNAWKFSMNILGANLKKEGNDDNTEIIIPKEYGLSQNYPNPFNPSTTIRYQLPESNHVTLQIYDILGNLIATLVDQNVEAGYHSVNWNASSLASGIYFYRITSGSFLNTKKLMLMK